MTVTINGTTGVSGVAGSASTPALIGSDADSGYYINSANEPNASVNGTAVWSAASTFGFRNRIINGGMVIDQRGSASSPVASGYGVDRFFMDKSGAGVVSFGQSSTAPAGFTNSTLVTVTTADASIAASDIYYFAQSIEGYNAADLGFGTADAKTVTLSFWVRSSVTGTYGAVLANSGGTRSYVSNYTINSANTWEYKTITVPGDTTGTWLTNSGVGIGVRFGLSAGANWQGTAGTWGTANAVCSSSQVNWMGTLGNTFYITGVQLEKGSTATSFDYRPYGTELQLCQRYYIKIAATTSGPILGLGAADSSTTSQHFGSLPVPMRSSPTYSFSSVNVSTITGSVYAVTGNNGINSDGLVYRVFFAVGGGGLTATTVPYFARANTTGYVDFSAEL